MKQKRLIIVEGPDACGKTTFAQQLADMLGGVYWHVTCTKTLAPAMLDYQLNAVANAQANIMNGQHVVLDRLWPSEYCYGPVLRPDQPIDTDRIRFEASALSPIYIFCLDSAAGEPGAVRAENRHRRHIDPAHPYDAETYLRVYRNYEALYKELAQDERTRETTIVRPFDERIKDQDALGDHNHAFISAIVRKFDL